MDEVQQSAKHKVKGWLAGDTKAAAVLLGLGIAFLWGGLQLKIGTPQRMGPGYYPVGLSVILIVTSAVLLARGRLQTAITVPVHWRSLMLISFSILSFAGVLSFAGLVPALVACISITTLLDGRNSLKEVIILTTVATAMLWTIFIVLLAMPIQSFRSPW